MTDQPDRAPTIAAALAELQTQLPHIAKDSKADIPNRPPHKYAALGSLSHELLPIMGKLGLSFSCKPTVRKGQFGMAYKLRLAGTDEVEKGFWPIPGGQPQAQGGALTYYRRYTLQCLTGAVAEDDDDGQAATQAQPGKPARTPRGKPATQAPTGGDGGVLEPEYEPGSALPSQLKAIHTSLTNLGITDRDKGLTVVEQIIGHPLAGPHRAPDESDRTTKNLSWQDAEKVKKELARRAAVQREDEPAT
jgi:ERF superfamily